MSKHALAYVSKDTPLHNLNPLTVIVYVLAITVLGLAISKPLFQLALFAINLALVLYGKVFRNFMYMFIRVTLPITIPMFIVHSLFYPNWENILYEIGPIIIRAEGVEFASQIIFRLLAILSAYFLMVLIVDPRSLMVTLSDRGLSPKIGYLILSTLQLIPYIQQTAERILDAQRSRGLSLKGSLIQRFKNYLPLMTPVVIGGFSTLEVRAMAMEVRGINLKTRRHHILEVPDTKKDKIFRWLIAIISVLVLIASFFF